MRIRTGLLVMSMLAGVGALAVGVASTPGQASTEVRLTAAGDYGATPDTARVLDLIAERSPDAHLAVGDLSYGHVTPENTWCRFVKQHVGETFPFELVSGNHESLDNDDGAINDFSACLPNQVPGIVGTYGHEYFMDFPRSTPLVRVIQTTPFLTFDDGRRSYAEGDAHYNWLSEAIDDGRARGAQWIVVTSHYPCLTVGANGCSQPRDFYDLLIEKRVDVVLHGHDHSYARTHQLRAGVPGCPVVPVHTFDADCVVDADDDLTAGQGTVFATVGTGGIPLRDVSGDDSEAGYFAVWAGRNANPTFGVLEIDATEDHLRADFLAASGGDFSDSFTITKRAAPPPTTTSSPTTSTSTTSTTSPTSTTTTSTTSTTSTVVPSTTTSTTSTTSTTTTSTTTPNEQPPLADDSFDRSEATGWGRAPTGGLWTVSDQSSFSVHDGVGSMIVAGGRARTAHLREVHAADVDMTVTLSNDKVGTGSGLYISVVPRAVVGAGEYRAVLRTRSDGTLTLRIDRSASTIAAAVVVPDIRYVAGMPLDVRVTASGTSPTTLTATVWESGTNEPDTPLLSVTDNGASLQHSGSVGFYVYLSSSASNSPITMSVDQLLVDTDG